MLMVFSAGCASTDDAASISRPPDFTGLWVISERTLRGDRDENFERLKPEQYLNGAGLEATASVQPAYDPSAMCLPSMPRHLGGPYPIEIIQNEKRVVLLFEYDNIFRIIYTDGSEHPDPDVDTRFMGHAAGEWSGDVLVVDTTNFNGKAWLSGSGLPVSQQARLTEWYELADEGRTLQVTMRIEDPVYMTRPVWRKYFFNLKNEWSIKEYLCAEGNRDNVFQQKEGLPGSLKESDILGPSD